MEKAVKIHNDTNQKAVSKIKARIIGGVDVPIEKRAGRTELMSPDTDTQLMTDNSVIEPPFDLLTLAMLPEHSSEMNQCIETMENNIDGFGHRFVPRLRKESDNTAPKKILKAIQQEKVDLINFFQYCTTESFVDFRKRLRKDLETTGNAYFEVVRDIKGNLQSFNHIPSYQIRICKEDSEPHLNDKKILKLQIDGSVVVDTITEQRRFRKFVQTKLARLRNLSSVGGAESRWFKEFGDKREYDAKTGEPYTGKKNQILANEMIHIKLYSSRTPYGLPRYIGNLLSIYGDRAAEEINYMTFRNNNIPSMVILVSNGQLTEGSLERVQSFVESQIQGSDNYSKFLLLEAEGTDEEGEDSGSHSKVEIKPLTENQHKDALFQNYSANNQDRVRRAWRLPPIYVGKSDDYTRATADSSRVLADEQIFAPERESFDQLINRIIFPEMGIVYHQYRSNSPNTTDNQQMVEIVSGSEKTGGMTPRIARAMLEEMLSKELPDFPEDFPADVPFSLTMAEAVKNKADPSEPGQQVTALKSYNSDGKTLVSSLAELNKKLETELQSRIESDRTESIIGDDWM